MFLSHHLTPSIRMISLTEKKSLYHGGSDLSRTHSKLCGVNRCNVNSADLVWKISRSAGWWCSPRCIHSPALVSRVQGGIVANQPQRSHSGERLIPSAEQRITNANRIHVMGEDINLITEIRSQNLLLPQNLPNRTSRTIHGSDFSAAGEFL